MAQKTLLYMRPGDKQFRVADENQSSNAFTLDADGKVITNQLAHHQAPRSSGNLDTGLHAYPVFRSKSALIVDRTNSVWIVEGGKRLIRIPTPRQITDALSDVNAANPETYDIHPTRTSMLLDHEGNVWFCDAKGVYRFFYSSLHKQELPSERGGFAIAADDGGAMWIGSWFDSDLFRVANGKLETHHFPRRIGSREPLFGWSLVQRADKTVWFGGKSGLWRLVHGNFVPINVPGEMIDDMSFLQAIAEDRAGGVWISFGRHGLYRLAEGVWTPFGGREDLPKTGVVTEFTDSLGRLWFGFTKNQLAVLDGDRLELFGPSEGVRVGNITAIYGRGPQIWIGGEFGLQQVDQGRFRNILAVDNDWLLGISGIVETASGDLWLNGLSGIFKISRDEISKALRDPSYRVRGEHLGSREGLPGNAAQIRPLPTAVEGSDGRLWFAEYRGVVWLDPTVPLRTAQPAPITIQSVSADDKDYVPVFPLTLPAHTSSVRINYVAVSLADPEAIRFRYKLLEMDPDWHEATRHDPVTYRNLSPGSYHFIISDSDTNGVWSDKIANADFTILPTWYQTTWFRTACVGAFLLLLWALYQFRLRQFHQQFSIGLEARVNERTRIARELHDTLLQSLHGLMFRFQAARNMLPGRPEQAMQALDGAIARTEQAIAESRGAIQDLRSEPVAQSELAELLTAMGQELAAFEDANRDGPFFRVVVEGGRRRLSPILQAEVYGIARELLRNAFQHAGAHRIEAEIRYEDHLFRLRVRDDGKGMDPKVLEAGGRAGHWGLPGVRERAQKIGARLDFWTEAGAGTEVQLTVPAAAAYENSRDGAIRAIPKGEDS
jgi:signal transduction histidine kinase